MSKINATISAIESEGIINIITFSTQKTTLKMISLELNEKVVVGQDVILITKATSVALAKDLVGELSYSNQIPCTIESIDQGKILTTLLLKSDFLLESIITTASLTRMKLQMGDKVTALIKSSDLSISEFLSC